MGCHPAEPSKGAPSGTHNISFYCDDIQKTVAELRSRGVEFTDAITDMGYGLVTHFKMPGDCRGPALPAPVRETVFGTVSEGSSTRAGRKMSLASGDSLLPATASLTPEQIDRMLEIHMRVSLVTETYFPQVNGVSRTLGELVRHLTEQGDQVQLIHPDYGEPAERARPPPGPVRQSPFLQGALPAASPVRSGPTGDRRLPARPGSHRHRGDPRPERAAARASPQDPGRLELPHQLRPVQPPLPRRLGQGDDLALPPLVP